MGRVYTAAMVAKTSNIWVNPDNWVGWSQWPLPWMRFIWKLNSDQQQTQEQQLVSTCESMCATWNIAKTAVSKISKYSWSAFQSMSMNCILHKYRINIYLHLKNQVNVAWNSYLIVLLWKLKNVVITDNPENRMQFLDLLLFCLQGCQRLS